MKNYKVKLTHRPTTKLYLTKAKLLGGKGKLLQGNAEAAQKRKIPTVTHMGAVHQ